MRGRLDFVGHRLLYRENRVFSVPSPHRTLQPTVDGNLCDEFCRGFLLLKESVLWGRDAMLLTICTTPTTGQPLALFPALSKTFPISKWIIRSESGER